MTSFGALSEQLQLGIDHNVTEQEHLNGAYVALQAEAGPAGAAVAAIDETAGMQTGIVNGLEVAQTRAAEIAIAVGALIGGVGGIQSELLETQRRTDSLLVSSAPRLLVI